MKKFITITLFSVLLHSYEANSQITLEQVFDSTAFGSVYNFYCTDIGNNDFKYVFIDTAINGFSLYNMDMSPFLLNVIIPVSDSIKQGFTLFYITKTLFDCDSTNVEYAYEWSLDPIHPFRIFRTDGTLLFQVDSANGPYCFGCYGGAVDERPILNTSAGAKLFLQKYDVNHVPQVLVYGLCGILPEYVDLLNHWSFVKVFPNPSSGEINFEIIPPNNQDEFQIVIYNNSGEKLTRVSLANNKGVLDVTNFRNGVYNYSLIAKNKTYQNGKFVLTK